jgi:hypothetical protein
VFIVYDFLKDFMSKKDFFKFMSIFGISHDVLIRLGVHEESKEDPLSSRILRHKKKILAI